MSKKNTESEKNTDSIYTASASNVHLENKGMQFVLHKIHEKLRRGERVYVTMEYKLMDDKLMAKVMDSMDEKITIPEGITYEQMTVMDNKCHCDPIEAAAIIKNVLSGDKFIKKGMEELETIMAISDGDQNALLKALEQMGITNPFSTNFNSRNNKLNDL